MLIQKSSCCSVSVETVPHRTVELFCYSTSIAEYGGDVHVDMFIV